MAITLAQICNAIESTLAAATTVARSESYDELTEGVQDFPMLQVYPEAGNVDAVGSTDRTTLQAGCRQTSVTIHADYYARQRSQLDEDMKALVNGIDALTNVLEQQDTKPYFGLDGIRAFRWEWRRVTFVYGDGGQPMVGARFVLTVRVF
jgi:hypothetical protein